MRRELKAITEKVRVWHRHGLLMEHYVYPPGAAGELTPHTHAEYQICVSVNAPGEYWYRGARHAVPARSVTIIHPHEVHAARDVEVREASAEFWVFYVATDSMREITGARSAPIAREMVSMAPDLFSLISKLPEKILRARTRLQHDAALGGVFGELLGDSGVGNDERPIRAESARLDRVRRFIDDACDEDLSMAELACVAGMSTGRLSRAFRERFGRPPHRYLVQMRVERAKRLLADGVALSEVAAVTGFADQSHLTRHFRNLTGVTPGRYGDFGRNVQDDRAPELILSPTHL